MRMVLSVKGKTLWKARLEMTGEKDEAVARVERWMSITKGVEGDHGFLGNPREFWEGDCCLMLTLKCQEDLLWRVDGSSSWE